jgi:hypothetical protein
MPRFASETSVPVERSRAEIEETLRRCGATEFHSGWKAEAAMIGFRLKELFIRFILPFPSRSERRFTHKKMRGHESKMSEQQSTKLYEQELRSRWRALLLVIKAKLEAVETGISSIEQEFLAFIQMPNKMTIGEWIIDQALPSIRTGQMPPLALPPGRENVIDAEFEET